MALLRGLLWAVKSAQFDDMEGRAHLLLMHEDEIYSGKGGEDIKQVKIGTSNESWINKLFMRNEKNLVR